MGRSSDRSGGAHLSECVFVREQYCHDGARSNQVLDFERVQIRIVCWFVIIEHEINRVRGRAYEDDLEAGVVEGARVIKCPEKIDVSRHVDDQIEELRFERDTRGALSELGDALDEKMRSRHTLDVFIF